MADYIGTEPEGHHISAYTMGSSVVLRCQCGKWERRGSTKVEGMQKLTDDALAHIARVVRAKQRPH